MRGRHGHSNEELLGAGMIVQPLRILNTPLAPQLAMVHILLPYMVLPIANALRQIDPSLPRAAAGLGATPWPPFPPLSLPLSPPSLPTRTLLLFLLTLTFLLPP